MFRLLSGCVLSIAALPAAAQVALPMATVVPEGTVLDVSATGRVSRTPDLATISAGVVTQAPVAANALSENARRMAAVTAALKAAGIAARDLSTSNVALSPQYRYQDNQPPAITGYQATNSVTIRFRDIARAGAVLDALVRAGANQIDGPNLSLSDPEGALDEARTQAIGRARARAELYAKAAGLSVGRIVAIDEAGNNDGGQPIRPMMMRASMGKAEADTAVLPGETDVTATVNVRFLLK
ncbi:SIMPL domain-containing protein [Sphingomonas endophytica]|uniref:Membrane protein n=1 Tax=Sphingomonas endophytica TaxID=869719 RepID=A0A147I1N2_9SPHN|nr:SIMPL domain-containing protein [Sphingomonas endophytica]KTT71483.1 membrane protein [Sphingomonas endophytica]